MLDAPDIAAPARPRRWYRSSGLVVAGAAILVALSMTGADAAPSPFVISGCFSRTTGVVRVVAPGAPCGPNEVAFTWNQEGPSGPAGPAGPAGPQGPAGPAGGGGTSIIGGGSPVLANSAPSYLGLYQSGSSATETVVAQVMPTGGTVSNLRADSEVDPGQSICIGATCAYNSWTLTLLRNGAPAGVSCTITGTTIYAAGQPCASDASADYAAGDTLSLKVTPGSVLAVPVPSAIHWTAAFTPG